jgi:hypothetical protein
LDEDAASTGQGPCVERDKSLYLFDEGGLSAFELATGKLRWHLPSVGITGMFFDESGYMYINTTSANLDSIKYSRQINLASRVDDIVMKIDCRKGKIVWRAEPGGMVNYVSGKYLYVVSEYQPYDEEEDMSPFASSGLSTGGKPYVRIRRINPRSGTEMWEHMEQRCPVDVQFDKNTIRLVFRKEVEVLKCFTF